MTGPRREAYFAHGSLKDGLNGFRDNRAMIRAMTRDDVIGTLKDHAFASLER